MISGVHVASITKLRKKTEAWESRFELTEGRHKTCILRSSSVTRRLPFALFSTEPKSQQKNSHIIFDKDSQRPNSVSKS